MAHPKWTKVPINYGHFLINTVAVRLPLILQYFEDNMHNINTNYLNEPKINSYSNSTDQ